MSALYAPDTVANITQTTGHEEFVKELWSDEVLAVYKANTVMSPLVQMMPFSGQKGDTVRIPKPIRGARNAKVEGTGVTLNVGNSSEFVLTIDQHFEYSRMIEDLIKIQALDSMRSFYTDDAGYAHALGVDADLHDLGAQFDAPQATATDVTNTPAFTQSIVATQTVAGTQDAWDDTTTGNGVAITDVAIRRMIQYLDDANVPARMRQLVIPPVTKNALLGIARFTEQAFVGEVGSGNSIRNGLVGDLYGIPVYVSTNCASLTSADATAYRQALFFQKEAVVMAEQLAPRAQSQYKQEFLADLFTVDTIYGLGVPRPENGISLIVPA